MLLKPNSLVRDNDISLFENKGDMCTYEIINDFIELHQEIIKRIKIRFDEGYLISEDKYSAIADLCETIELLYALANIQGVKREDMERIVNDKRKANGGYEKGIKLLTIETRR